MRSWGGVRAVHRTGPPGGRSRPGGGADVQAQLHRHRAHPARAAPQGGGPRGPSAREPRHHRRARPRSSCPHRRLRRGGHLRADPPHPARQEGPRGRSARGVEPRPHLHRHRAHPAEPRARQRGCCRPHPARLRGRLREDPQRGHPHALRPRRTPPGPGDELASCRQRARGSDRVHAARKGGCDRSSGLREGCRAAR